MLVGLNSSSSSFFMRKATNIDSINVVFIAYKGRRKGKRRAINVIFDIADL